MYSVYFISNDESEQKDELVPNHGSVLGAKTLRLRDSKVTIGQNQQVNIDVNKPIDPSLQLPQQFIAPKPTNPQATVLSQQGSYSGPSNLSVQKSTESTQSGVVFYVVYISCFNCVVIENIFGIVL